MTLLQVVFNSSSAYLLLSKPLLDAQVGIQSLWGHLLLYSPTSSPCLQQIPSTIFCSLTFTAVMKSVISIAGPLLPNKLLLELMLMTCNDFVRGIWEWKAYQCVKETNNDRSLPLVIGTQTL